MTFFLSWKDYFRTSFRCIRSGQRDHLHGTEINFCYIGKKNAIIESCLFLGSLPLIAAYNPIIRQCCSIWNGSFLLGAVQFGTEVFFAPRTRHLARFRWLFKQTGIVMLRGNLMKNELFWWRTRTPIQNCVQIQKMRAEILARNGRTISFGSCKSIRCKSESCESRTYSKSSDSEYFNHRINYISIALHLSAPTARYSYTKSPVPTCWLQRKYTVSIEWCNDIKLTSSAVYWLLYTFLT